MINAKQVIRKLHHFPISSRFHRDIRFFPSEIVQGTLPPVSNAYIWVKNSSREVIPSPEAGKVGRAIA
jgi:hypothetical protein